MNGPRPQPPYGVPTLTEVVEPHLAPPPVAEPPQPLEPVAAHQVASQADSAAAAESAPPVRPPEPPPFDEGQLIERVLADLQRQVELMLEYRLREVLTPALQRATDALVRDARVELASTLRDVVARAVAQELLRHRGR